MILFHKIIAPAPPVQFSRATKEIIYGYLESGLDPSEIFKRHGIPTEDTELIIHEIEAKEQELFSKIRGTWVLTPEVRDNEGNVTTPAVMFQYTTRTALMDSMTWTYVIKSLFMDDIVAYYPTYDVTRTFNQFVTAVKNG